MKTDDNTHKDPAPARPEWSPYLAGFGLGLVLLFSYVTLGAGLGASGGLARVAAWLQHTIMPQHVEGCAYFGEWFGVGQPHVMSYYLVFMMAGVFVGGLMSALGSGRIRSGVERGPRMSARGRLCMALLGGVLVGFTSRLARGCTSGQALSGTAMLYTGSVVFLVCIFVGAYATAYFVRKEWL